MTTTSITPAASSGSFSQTYYRALYDETVDACRAVLITAKRAQRALERYAQSGQTVYLHKSLAEWYHQLVSDLLAFYSQYQMLAYVHTLVHPDRPFVFHI